jgi:glycosyltransferase involved in cell wall biosynthesis
MTPDISVVIPLYNKERYIRRSIDSVLNQTFDNLELIVVDSSDDQSTGIVQTYTDPRIIHILYEKSTAARARNHGARVAHSELIAFLDADDEWQPDHIETLVRLRKNYPDAGLYSTPYVKIRPGGKPQVMLFVGISKPPWEGYLSDYLRICSRGDEPVHSSSCAVPRNVFEETGGFPEQLKYGEDQYLWGIISLSYPVAYSWKGLAIYHTEAKGRICDEAHIIKGNPFSEYLQKELDTGRISMEKTKEFRSYIRRKHITITFGNFLNRGMPGSSERGSPAICADEIHETKRQSGLKIYRNILGTVFMHLYQSSVHDSIRKVLCRLYGCHNLQNDAFQKRK